MGTFPYKLTWTVLPSGRRRIIDDFTYILDKDLADQLGAARVDVLAPFVSDGGSIPRIFWTIASPYTGKAVFGYVVHDWVVEKKLCSWALAAKIMKRCFYDRGVNIVLRNVIYSAVRSYGFVARK